MTAHHTPERLAIIRETWDQPVRIEVILARLNATPGHLPVTNDLAAAWASQQGIRRHPHPHHTPIVPLTGPVTDIARQAALHRLAHGQWTAARMEKLCVAWEAGVSCEQIALSLGITKNAVAGKTHRLAKRGLLTTRPSPIIRNGPREPKPAPAPRPVNVPTPTVTLPPLPSVAVERVYTGLPKFNFATHRPPRPVPLARWVADDGSWPTGPARRPCQFVTQPGSVVDPWIFCGLPVSRGAWCSFHVCIVYHTHQRRAA